MLSIPAAKTIMALLQLSNMFVAASPVEKDFNVARDDAPAVTLGEHPDHRTVVVIMCMSYVLLLALAQGYRIGRMAGRQTSAKFSDILVFAQGFIGTAYIFSVGINSAGLGLSTDAQCYAAIRVCIAMYGAAKITLYLFLLERVRIVRAPFIDRSRDPIWVIGAVLNIGGFAAIMAYEFVAPMSELSRVDGICRIGIHPDAGMAVLALDTTINVALTGIFFWQLRPALGLNVPWASSWRSNDSSVSYSRNWNPSFSKLLRRNTNEKDLSPARVNSQHNLRMMLLRSIVGCSLVLCATISNNVIFLSWSFATHSYACQLMCLTDIVLGTLVSNWLTIRSATDLIKGSKRTDSNFGIASANTRRPTMEFAAQEFQGSSISTTKLLPAIHAARGIS